MRISATAPVRFSLGSALSSVFVELLEGVDCEARSSYSTSILSYMTNLERRKKVEHPSGFSNDQIKKELRSIISTRRTISDLVGRIIIGEGRREEIFEMVILLQAKD